MLNTKTEKYPWPRGQKFGLSDRGAQIEAEYREVIVASRALEGRASFNAARASWAASHLLEEDDGLYLAEIRAEPMNLKQLVDALESCEKRRADAVGAVKRLFDAGYLALQK